MDLQVLIQGEGFPILCLHGHPGMGSSMAVFTQHLSQRYKTIAPDLRGYGNSQTAADFAMTDHLTDLDALLDRLKIERYLVLGWSLGGILALELALRSPDRVSGLILVASAARPWGDHPPITWQDNLYTGIAGIVNWLQPGRQWHIDSFGKRSLFRHLVQTHTPATYQYLAQAAVPAYLRTSRRATRALFTAIRQCYNRLPDLPQIQCPSLVLAGERDRALAKKALIQGGGDDSLSGNRVGKSLLHLQLEECVGVMTLLTAYACCFIHREVQTPTRSLFC